MCKVACKKNRRRSQMFSKVGVLEIFAIFTGKHLHFPVNVAKILRTPNLENICERLLVFSACHFAHACLF